MKETPYKEKPIQRGAKVPLFRRAPVNAPTQNVSFTGSGVVPDVMSEHGPKMLSCSNHTTLEAGERGNGVHGADGMMPPAGSSLKKMQAGQKPDEGAGGAGSFAARLAFSARG